MKKQLKNKLTVQTPLFWVFAPLNTLSGISSSLCVVHMNIFCHYTMELNYKTLW